MTRRPASRSSVSAVSSGSSIGALRGSFVLLAVTGVGTLFGKHVLVPIIGHAAFGFLLNLGKIVHNYIGPLFMASLLVDDRHLGA